MSRDASFLTAAAVFAAEAHINQRRKELNEPYINHPLRVGKLYAELVDADDVEAIAAAFLHDVPEDTDVPMATIYRLFPTRTARLTDVCTKWWSTGQFTPAEEQKHKRIYYERIIGEGAINLKFCDRIDNLRDFVRVVRIAPANHAWAQKYYDKTKAEFVPLVEHIDCAVFEEFSAAYESLRLALG